MWRQGKEYILNMGQVAGNHATWVGFLGLLSVLLLASCAAPSTSPSPTATGNVSGQTSALLQRLSLAQLTNQADLIALGTVASAASYWNEQRDSIFTDINVSIEDVVKGDVAGYQLTVRLPGGQVGNITQLVSDIPTFAIGEEVFLFLQREEEDTCFVVGGFQGKYTVENGDILGQGKSLPELISDIQKIMGGASETEQPWKTTLK
jgi:hypothetical protein